MGPNQTTGARQLQLAPVIAGESAKLKLTPEAFAMLTDGVIYEELNYDLGTSDNKKKK